MTKDEWKKILKEAFPDEVQGYKRGDTVPSDAPYMEDFPPFISKDKVIYTLINLVIRQMLSNDKELKAGYESADKTLTDLVSSINTRRGQSHTLTLQGDVTGSSTFTNESNITVTTTNKTVAKGMIVMWYGNANAIPNGWVICNGSNGTPDLRDRFVIGAGGNYGLGWTGGEASHTLSVDEMPAHKHVMPWGETGEYFNPPWGRYGNGNLHGSGESDSDNYWAYSSPTGGSKAHNNMPPYYGLYFIMKL